MLMVNLLLCVSAIRFAIGYYYCDDTDYIHVDPYRLNDLAELTGQFKGLLIPSKTNFPGLSSNQLITLLSY